MNDAKYMGLDVHQATISVAVLDSAGKQDLDRSLPYPSANRWILDQVALWFALGHIAGMTYEDYSPRDVLQNGEILTRSLRECDWILCHYFSQNTERLTNWLNQTHLENNVTASVTGSSVIHVEEMRK